VNDCCERHDDANTIPKKRKIESWRSCGNLSRELGRHAQVLVALRSQGLEFVGMNGPSSNGTIWLDSTFMLFKLFE
jgi:hypothetical protein